MATEAYRGGARKAKKTGRSPASITNKACALGLTDPDWRSPDSLTRREAWVPTEEQIRGAARVERARAPERKRDEDGQGWDDRDHNNPRLSARMERGPTVLSIGRKEGPL